MEGCIDDLCRQGDFDRWQFRYDNALTEGGETVTGQILERRRGLRETLLAVKEHSDRRLAPGSLRNKEHRDRQRSSRRRTGQDFR